jgi:hypothetical protein
MRRLDADERGLLVRLKPLVDAKLAELQANRLQEAEPAEKERHALVQTFR